MNVCKLLVAVATAVTVVGLPATPVVDHTRRPALEREPTSVGGPMAPVDGRSPDVWVDRQTDPARPVETSPPVHDDQRPDDERPDDDRPDATAAPRKTPEPESRLDEALFHADMGTRGISAYRSLHPASMLEGRDYGAAADPAGDDRVVMWFDSSAGLTHGNSWSRASVQTPKVILPADDDEPGEYWMELSVYLPEDQAFDDPGDWSTLATGGYGAPWGGPSPLSLMLVRPDVEGPHVLRMGNDDELLGRAAVVPTDTWTTVTLHYRAAEDGWVEMWLDSGDGPRRIQVDGRDRAPYDVVRRGVNDAGPLYSVVGMYGNDATRIYVADHAIGRTEAAADVDGVRVSGAGG